MPETAIATVPVTVNPHGFQSPAVLCDEYYTWDDPCNAKIRGFVFWFADCFDPPLYFVPMSEPQDKFGAGELPIYPALEAWIDHLFANKSCDIIGGGYEGSQSMHEWAAEMEYTEEEAYEHITMSGSYYGIDQEPWQCRETYIEADGLEGMYEV